MKYLTFLLIYLFVVSDVLSQAKTDKMFKATTLKISNLNTEPAPTFYLGVLRYNNEVLGISPVNILDLRDTTVFMFQTVFSFHKSKLKADDIISAADYNKSNMSLSADGNYHLIYRLEETGPSRILPCFTVTFEKLSLYSSEFLPLPSVIQPSHINRLFKPTTLQPNPEGLPFSFGLLKKDGKEILAVYPFGTQAITGSGLTYKFWFNKSRLKPEQVAELITDFHFQLYQDRLVGFDWVRPNTPTFKNIPAYMTIHPEFIRLK